MYYGDRPNFEFFLYCGFIMKNNRNDFLKFKMSFFDFPEEAPTGREEKYKLLERLGFSRG
jgi:hypothetical protein